MPKHYNKNEMNSSFLDDELISNNTTGDEMFDEEYSDEIVEEYNEEMYKWLSVAILLIWLVSIIYL